MSAGSPAATATLPAAPRTRARGRARRLDWSTPVQLWTLLGAVAVSALLTFLSVSLGIADSARAIETVGTDSAPTINDALNIYFAVSDMDADAADYLLLNGHSTASLTPLEALNRYEQRRQAASDLLISASHDIAYGESEHRAVLRMLVMIQIFDAYVGQAEVLNDHGDRAGALAAYEQATTLMHAPQSGMLETALGLAASLHGNLTTGYETAQADESRDIAFIVVSGLLLFASLVWLQVFLARRMRRALNPPALAATVLALALVAGAISVLHANGERLRVAKQDGYDSVYALRQLRAIAFDAKADESRYLIDPQQAQFYQQSFLEKSVELASFRQRVSIGTYDAALARQLAVLDSGAQPTIGGAFGRALHDVVFPGEEGAARTALTAYAKWERDDRILRADAGSGNQTEAIRFDSSGAPNDSDGDFSAFDTALGGWIQIHQRAFDQTIAAGSGSLNGWQLYPALAALGVVLLTWLGLRPRLREYSGIRPRHAAQ